MKYRIRSASGSKLYLLVLLLTLAATLAIYLQTVTFGYAGYDDKIITREDLRAPRGLSAESLARILTPHGMMTYQPLRDLATEAVYEISGTEPWGYHWFNLLLFLANLAAVFWLLCRLLGLFTADWPGGPRLWAALGAAWFAVHPVHVEAVAWMNSNKELLSGLFYFLALGFYIDSRGRGTFSPRYLAGWLCFLLGLAAKPSGAAFPLVLVALELLVPDKAGKGRAAAIRVAPFLLLAVAAGLFVVFRSSTSTGVWLQGSVLTHALSMASVLGRYVITMLLPVNLCHSYPPPFFFGDYDWRLALYLLLDAGLAAGAWLCFRRGERAAAFGILFFLLNLLPVSGIIPIAVFRADRYLYVPSLGLILTGLALLSRLALDWTWRRVTVLLSTLALVLLGVMAAVRCRDWRDAVPLWQSSVRTHGNFQYNYFGLGLAYQNRGMLPEALEAFRGANRFQDNFQCHYWSGRIFAKLGQPDSARVHLEKAESMFTPEMAGQMEEMANIYRMLGQSAKLADHLFFWAGSRPGETALVLDNARELARLGDSRRAVELIGKTGEHSGNPGVFYLDATGSLLAAGALDAAAYTLDMAGRNGADREQVVMLGADLAFAAGQWERAVQLYATAGEDKLNIDRLERLAAAHLRSGNPAKALMLFRSLAASNPGAAQLNNIGAVLEALDSLGAAESQFRAAVALDSSYADGWYNLGRVLGRQERLEESLSAYQHASMLEEKSTESMLAVARTQVQLKKNEDAAASYDELLRLNPTDMNLLLEAADFAWDSGQKDTAGEYYNRLALAIPAGQLPPRVSARRK